MAWQPSDPWELFNWAASLGFTLCLGPQLWRTLQLRRADDLSIYFLVLVNISAALMLVYSIHIKNWAFTGAQSANLLVWGTVLFFKLRPGKTKAEARKVKV